MTDLTKPRPESPADPEPTHETPARPEAEAESPAPAEVEAGTGPESPADPEPTAAAPVEAPPVEAVAAARKSRRPLWWGIARWTAAVLVCGGVGAGTALGITGMERSEVPGLSTLSDGRWTYPELSLPALPEGSPRPFTDGNDGEVHHADLRRLLLPAPAGATVDPKLRGGWTGLDSYLEVVAEKDRAAVREHMADSTLRHVAARGWTMPDGTATRIHLLRFSSVAYAEAYRDESAGKVLSGERLPPGVEAAKVDTSTQDVKVPNLSLYSYREGEPAGPEETRWSFIQAGDTLAVITQTRKGGILAVPFQQTVALQAQLLG
ncbi:hypothetical protein [Streptomyces termitum]|uniref:hypothetical protein n=1 Tax=Streptomyces termitum TaxID=67368 RepID=UPI0033AA3834